MFAPIIFPFEPWRIKHNQHHAHTNKYVHFDVDIVVVCSKLKINKISDAHLFFSIFLFVGLLKTLPGIPCKGKRWRNGALVRCWFLLFIILFLCSNFLTLFFKKRYYFFLSFFSVAGWIYKTFLGSPLKLWASVGHWAIWHFDLNKYTEQQKPRVITSLVAVFAFMAIGWPLIVHYTGWVGFAKYWLMPWLGYHFWMSKFLLFPF